MNIDKDIDEMQGVIEGKCGSCGCPQNTHEWDHSRNCVVYEKWFFQFGGFVHGTPRIPAYGDE